MSKDRVCVDCGGKDVHYIEFRTDYVRAKYIDALNDNDEIDNDDLPCHLGGHYCHRCRGFCSVKTKE